MKTNDAALKIITEFEGFRADPYQCSAGVWTIGYGSTRDPAGQPVSPDTPPLTMEQALAWMQRDLAEFEARVTELVKVPITADQFGALVSLTYNIGPVALAQSTLLRKLNAGDSAGAADEFPKWRKAGGRVLPGLVRRRAAERELFLKNGV